MAARIRCPPHPIGLSISCQRRQSHICHPGRSQEEVARLIDAADTPFHRTVLITLYATGLRCAELTQLKASGVDSKRMVIHVQGGKAEIPDAHETFGEQVQQETAQEFIER